jgi:hippurate hydrolase
MPHESLDPIPVACEIVMALQSLIARTVPVTILPSSPSRKSAPAPLIIRARLCRTARTLRTLSEVTRQRLHEDFRRIVTHVAAAHGLTAEATVEEGYPVTTNDVARSIWPAMRPLARGDDPWMELPPPIMGAEDFAYVLREIPGRWRFSERPRGQRPCANPPLHNTRMTIDEEMMAKGSRCTAPSPSNF